DINPYLMLAAVLGAALNGVDDAVAPPAPVTGNAYALTDLPQLAPDWASAISAFESSPLIARIFAPLLISNMVMTKRQELARFADLPRETHWHSYLEAV
ncbi:MAG: glutamine synthetase, partial [Rhodobacteraceae bacterium]